MTYQPRSLEHHVRDAELMLSGLNDWGFDEEDTRNLVPSLLSEVVATQAAQASATLALVWMMAEIRDVLRGEYE